MINKRRVGAVAAAFVVAGFAGLPARAGERPKAPEPLQPGAHQVVFQEGKAAYNGPLDERLGIRGAVKQAPELSALAAYEAAARRSLRQLDAPVGVGGARSFGGSSSHIERGGDWDGDGTVDVLGVEHSPDGMSVVALGGRTGAELWRWNTDATEGFARPASVGDGENGVIVASNGGSGAVLLESPTATITALGGDGEVRWEKSYRGAWVSAGFGTTGRNLPVIEDVAQFTDSRADDVLISRWTWVNALGTGSIRTAIDVVDGRDGSVRFSVNSPWNNEGLSPVAAPDVSGDGLRDILLVGESTLVALRGTDGQTLWRSENLPIWYIEPIPVGDVSGDGRPDLAIAGDPDYHYGYHYGPRPSQTVLVDGASGARLSAISGLFPVGAGDVDGDGVGDVSTAEATYDDDAGVASVVYRTFKGNGQSLGSQTYAQADDWDTWTYVSVFQVGDVQADGAPDWAHAITSYDEDGERRTERAVVSGRTSLRLWSGRVGGPARGSVDGDGDDLLFVGSGGLQAQDGKTGQELWVAATPRNEAYAPRAIGDLDGDGREEVAVALYGASTGYTSRTRVLAGADGSLRWEFGGTAGPAAG